MPGALCSDVFTIDDIDIFACCGVVKSAKMNIYLRAIKISQPAKVNCDIECGSLPLAFPARFERAAFRLGGERSILLSYGNMHNIDRAPIQDRVGAVRLRRLSVR